MALPDATHKASCDAVAALGNWIAVFTDAAGTTGANEASGGSYARKQTTYPTGAMVGSYWTRVGSTVNIPVPAGTYKEAGAFSAATAGTFVGSAPFDDGDVTVSGSGASINVSPKVEA